MTDDPRPFDDAAALDAYVDGVLAPDERLDFERRLAEREDLRGQVELQQRIDAALRRRFAGPAPAAVRLNLNGRAARAGGAGPRRLPRARLAAAAILVAALGVGNWLAWTQWSAPQRSGRGAAPPRPTLAAVYDRQVDEGFVPAVECSWSEREFSGWFFQRFGQGLALAAIPSDVELVGLNYATSISRRTLLVLARVGGRPVVVFVDRAAEPPIPLGCCDSRLRLFEARVGDLALYEVTPLDAPRLLDRLYDPKRPREWYDEAPPGG